MLRLSLIGALAPAILVTAGCKARIEADDLPEDTNPAEEKYGTLEIYTTSNQSAAGTEVVTMDLGMVEAHFTDEEVIEELGAEWLVLTQEAGTFTVVEQEVDTYLVASADAPVSGYDALRVTILGGTYINEDGDEYTVDPPDWLGLDGELEIETSFCVSGGKTTTIDTEFNAGVNSITPSNWIFDLDVAVDDHGSCEVVMDE